MKWLRLWVYRVMLPMSQKDAMLKKQKLAILYGALGWIIFGFTVFHIANESAPKKKDGIDYVKLLNLNESTTIAKYSGFNKISVKNLKLDNKETEDLNEISENAGS